MNGGNQLVKRGFNISFPNYRRDTIRGISGDITCSKLISCAIFSRKFGSHIVCLIIVMQLSSIHCLRLQFRERKMLVSISATYCDETYHNADCSSLDLRWHFITPVVSTETYNVNSILCQCTIVIKLPIVLHVMVNIEVKEAKKWNKAKRV